MLRYIYRFQITIRVKDVTQELREGKYEDTKEYILGYNTLLHKAAETNFPKYKTPVKMHKHNDITRVIKLLL